MHDEAQLERMRKAVKVFRQMQPMLTSYAKAITGNPKVRVVLSSSSAMTDGTNIFFRPPLALGDETTHDKRNCDKRDPGTYLQLCKACAVREEVYVNIFHEIGHIAYDSFAKADERSKLRALEDAASEMGERYRDALVKKFRGDITDSYLGLSNLINPYLNGLFGAIEDARVDGKMFQARPGIRTMLQASTLLIFKEGLNPYDGQEDLEKWIDAPLNAQVAIACIMRIDRYRGWEPYLHPDVVRHTAEPSVQAVLDKLTDAKTVEDTFRLALPLMEALREFGYFQKPEEIVPPEPPPSDGGKSDESDDSDNEDSSDGEDAGDSQESSDDQQGGSGSQSEDSSSSDGSDGDGSDDAADSSSDAGGDAGEGASSSSSDRSDSEDGDAVGSSSDDSKDSQGSDEVDDSQDGSGGGDQQEEAEGSEGSGGSDGGETESSDDAGESESSGGSDASGMADDSSDSSSGNLESGSEGSDSGESGDDPGDDTAGGGDSAGSAGESESGEQAGDDDTDSPDGSDSADEAGGESDGGDSEEGGSGEDTGEADETGPSGPEVPEDGDSTEGGTESEPGDSDGTDRGDSSEPEESAPPPPDHKHGTDGQPCQCGYCATYGYASDLNQLVETLHEHVAKLEKPETDDEEADPFGGRATDEHEFDTFIDQSEFMDTPSNHIEKVMIHHHGDSNSRHFFRLYPEEEEVPESVVAGSLLHARKTFADNMRAAQEVNLRSGRIRTSTLGRRAWQGDPRLFQRSRQPGRRDYSVLLGIDLSTSTNGAIHHMIRKAAMAQAEICHRLGLRFAVFGHSGNRYQESTYLGSGAKYEAMDIIVIKDFDEPWNEEAKVRMRSVQPAGANLDGHTLEYYRKQMDKERTTDRIIMYYTDGFMPYANGEEEREVLDREIKVCKRKGYTLMGVEVGERAHCPPELDTCSLIDESDVKNVVKHLAKRLEQR